MTIYAQGSKKEFEVSFMVQYSKENSKIDKKLNNLRKADDSNDTIGTRLYEQGKRSMEKKKKLVMNRIINQTLKIYQASNNPTV